MSWTPAQLPSFAGRTAVVTGANSGIGLVTATELARHGADVTLACRNADSAAQAADHIRTVAPDAQPRVAALDLSSLDSVRRFAEDWEGPLDLLVNNAGVMMPPAWQQTRDGFELQFGTNHLGHYALTGLLLPALLGAADPRVVTVSSIRHHSGDASVLDGNPQAAYRPQQAYGNSKLANLLFGRELQRRASEHRAALTSTMAHPGVSATGLVADRQGMGSNAAIRALAPAVTRLLFQSAQAGANPSLYAASVAAPGSYSGPQRVHEIRGPVGPAKLSRFAQDDGLAAGLWERSAELTGVEYAWPDSPAA